MASSTELLPHLWSRVFHRWLLVGIILRHVFVPSASGLIQGVAAATDQCKQDEFFDGVRDECRACSAICTFPSTLFCRKNCPEFCMDNPDNPLETQTIKIPNNSSTSQSSLNGESYFPVVPTPIQHVTHPSDAMATPTEMIPPIGLHGMVYSLIGVVVIIVLLLVILTIIIVMILSRRRSMLTLSSDLRKIFSIENGDGENMTSSLGHQSSSRTTSESSMKPMLTIVS